MIKSVLNTSYDFGEQNAHLIGVTKRGLDSEHMSKMASSSKSIFEDLDIKAEKGKAVVHVVAMGAAPHYPSNKNGDLFYDTNRVVEIPMGEDLQLEKGLDETYITFETNAKVFKEHHNKKTDKVYGDVLSSRYNGDMKRVELMLSIPVDEWEDELCRLESGEGMGVSMSASMKEDICGHCGNRARTRDDYCTHLKCNLNQITSDGSQIAAINDNVKFFDISGVSNPADRIAFGLLKAASSGVIGGAELAELLNIPTPLLPERYKFAATLRKLAELEKRFEGQATEILAIDPNCAAADTKDLPKDTIKKIAASGLNAEQTLGALADVKVTLSIKDFLQIVLGERFKEIAPSISGAEDRLPGVFSRMCIDPKVQDGVINLPSTPFPFSLGGILKDIVGSNGFGADPKRHRVTVTILKGKSPFTVKSASVKPSNDVEETLAQLYGQYKVALCHKFNDDNDLTFTSALAHYIQS